jgi:RNase P/RNase MRP subunit p29
MRRPLVNVWDGDMNFYRDRCSGVLVQLLRKCRSRAQNSAYAATQTKSFRGPTPVLALLLGLLLNEPSIASPPTAPASLSATAVSGTQTTLTWTASSDNLSITSYVIQRCQGSGCTSFAQVGTVPSGTAYSDSGLTAGTTYQYEVYATDSTGSGPNSNVASASTFPASVSGSTTYTYDALGRLVQANVPALGIVENYTYDASGNLLSMTSEPTATLAISDLSSPEGAPGSTLTIVGSGFSTNPSSDVVTINGVAATVVSATASELVVNVPAGATSGPIEVQTGTGTVISSSNFTVTTAVSAPTITSFLPADAPTGATVTLTGTGFSSALADNQVQVNQTAATVVAATPTSLTFVVPSFDGGTQTSSTFSAMSAPITVATPMGTATSPTDLVVSTLLIATPPIANVGGAAVTMPTPTASTAQLMGFTAIAGQPVELVASSLSTPSGVQASVFAPNGVSLTAKSFTAAGQSLQIPTPVSGRYSVYFYANGTGGSVSWSVLGSLVGALTLNGTPTTETVSVPGESAQLTFNGTQGQNVTLSFTSVTLSAATVTMTSPDGAIVLSQPLTTSGLTVSPTLPASGTYTVLVTPAATASGAFTTALTSTTASTFAPNQGVKSVTLTGTTPTTLTFTGSVGEIVSLAVSETAGTSSSFWVTVLQPDGTTLLTRSTSLCVTCGTTLDFNLGPLTQPGTYSLVVTQTGTATNTFALTFTTPLVGSTTIGSTANVTLTQLGQGALESFPGVAGQYVSASLLSSSAGLTPTGTIAIVGPDGTTIASGILATCTSGCTAQGVASAGPLPTTGTYTALFLQQSGEPGGSGSLTITMLPPVTGSLTVGTSNAVVVAGGQGFTETFTASAGQSLSVGLQSSSTGPTNGTASILDPNGVLIASTAFNARTGYQTTPANAVLNVGPLAIGGTYTVLVQQATSAAGLGAGTITVTPELTASGALTVGSASSVTFGAGQGLSETFNGTAGEYVSVALGSQSTTAPITGTIQVLSPTGIQVATASYSGTCSSTCSGAGNVNVGPLPTSGQYTLVFSQGNAFESFPGSGSMTVTPEAAVQGTLTLGTPANLTLAAGQGAQETFSGSAGQYATVSVSESASLIQGATVTVLGPSGSTVATGTFTATCSTTCSGTSSLNLGPLPLAGTYTVLLQQSTQAYGFSAGSLTLSLAGNTPNNGSSQNLSTSTAGAAAQFTFTAAALQSFELAFSNMVLTPSTVTSYTVKVVDPTGANVNNGNCTSGTTCLVPITYTKTGTYTVTVTPGGSATLSVTASVGPLVTGTLSVGTPFSLNLPELGENASLIFTATAGQDLALQVSGMTETPTGTSYTVDVYDPTSTLIAASYPTSSATLNLPIALTGTYTVSVSTTTGSTASMQLTLLTGPAASVPSTGTGVNISTSVASENAYYTFSGTYGQSVTLALGNIVETPSSAGVAQLAVTGPGPGNWGASCSSSCMLHFPPLPATGTYNAKLSPGSGATISATAYLTPDVTGAMTVGTPLNLTLSETGQSASVTFAVTSDAPQTLALYVSNLSASPSGTAYTVTVFNFNRQDASLASTQVTSSTIFNLPNLAPGTYVITLTPASPATATVQLTLEPQNGGTLTPTSSGSGSTFTTPAPGQNSYFTFIGTAGQNLSLAFSNISFSPSSVTYFSVSVTGPGFSAGATCYSSAPSSCAIPLRNLPQNGIYAVTVTPSGAATMTYTATLSSDASGTLTTGTAQNVTLGATGEDSWLTFNATAGQTVALNVAGIATVPANTSYTITVYNSAGTSIATATTTSGTTFNLPNLAAGAYNVFINSTSAATANMQVTVEPQSGGTLSLTTSGAGSPITTPAPGQNAYFTFSGTAGQNLTLALSGISFVPGSVTYPTVIVSGPSNYSVGGTCYATLGSCEIPLKTLPATGTYSVTVSPTGFATMSFAITLSSDFSATLTPSTAQSVPLTAMGQSAWLSFTATAGQTFALYASGIVSTPANTSYTVTVYNSAGTSVASGSSSSAVTLNLPTLAAGTYNVFITPATPATASMQVTLEPQAGGVVSFSGGTSAFSTPAPGQYAYFTFSGTAGQDLGLALTGLTLTPSSQGTSALVYVYEPNGTTLLTDGYCYTTNPGAGCQFSMTNLPVTGTYTIKVMPGTQQTMSFNLTASQDVSGTLALNTPQAVTLVPGQDTWLAFTATAGETVAVSASSIVTNPSGQSVTLTVYNSGGTSVGTTAGTSSATVNLANLAAGTYSVLAVPAYGASATLQVTLAAQTGAALTLNGSTTNYATTVPGQYAYFTFSGTAGQDLGLALTGLTLTPSSQGTSALVYVYEPNGTTLLTDGYCYTTNPGAGCQFSMTNLPVTGTYTIKVMPGTQQTMSFNLTASQDVSGTLALNTPQAVTLVPGQNTWLAFTATAGETVAVSASSIVTNPSGQTVTLTVYNSSGTSVGNASGTGSTTANLTNLAAGTYSVLIVPAYGASATMQVTLAAQTGAALTFNGSTTNYATTVPGQYAYFTFSGTAGQDLGLALTGLTLTPSSQGTSALVYVYEPNGTTLLTDGYCYTTNPSAGCQFSMTNLPVTGTYTIKVMPGTQQTMSFNLTASQDVSGTLALNTPQAVTLAATGQNAWFTFSITSAQTVTVTTSGINAVPANTSYSVTVYNSSGSSVGSTSTTTGNTLTLTNLAAGTYNILINPQYPATASLQLSYQ